LTIEEAKSTIEDLESTVQRLQQQVLDIQIVDKAKHPRAESPPVDFAAEIHDLKDKCVPFTSFRDSC